MTYSIVARDDVTGQLAVACQSHFFAPGASVTHGRPAVGVVATQAFVNGMYGADGLDGLVGEPAPAVLERLLRADPDKAVRQVALLGVHGDAASWTGDSCVGVAGSLADGPVAVQGNMLRSPRVLPAMMDGFATAEGDLADRVLAAMAAAEDAGGDARGSQGASLLVIESSHDGRPWDAIPIDLRVDDHPDPIRELRRLLVMRRAFDSVSGAMFAPGLMVGPYDEPSPGDLDRMLLTLDDAARVLAPSAEPMFWAGVLSVRAGRMTSARDYLERAITANSDLREFLAQVADAGFFEPRLIEELT